MKPAAPDASVLQCYGITDAKVDPIGSGLINHTWLVSTETNQYILQQVNPMFETDIHEDINYVTSFMRTNGMAIPRLLPNTSGKLFSQQNNIIWRLYDYIPGTTFDLVHDPEVACEAGRVLGEFHQLLNSIDYQFKSIRPGVHDTHRHLKNLEDALLNQQDHIRYKEIKLLGIEILNQAMELPVLPESISRKVHGDPKINNFLFKQDSLKAICILDYDTLSDMQIMLELGDAMRSWCNPNGEDDTSSIFSLENFQAGLQGYRDGSKQLLTDTEWSAILPATLTIYIELAARFCADALNENYFAWDPERYQSHSEHSQTRARSQLNAARSLLSQYKHAEIILANLR